MTSIKAFIRNHPVLAYYILTFAISWGCILLVIGGPGGIPGTPEQFARLLPFAILALLAGPSLAGLLLTGLVSGSKATASYSPGCSGGGWALAGAR
jgi:hypothetical protein